LTFDGKNNYVIGENKLRFCKRMSELTHKYNLLDAAARRELNDFLDFLLSKARRHDNGGQKSYKQNILKVSVWSEEDIKVLHEHTRLFDQWKPAEW